MNTTTDDIESAAAELARFEPSELRRQLVTSFERLTQKAHVDVVLLVHRFAEPAEKSGESPGPPTTMRRFRVLSFPGKEAAHV